MSLRDLLDLPREVKKSDFVIRIVDALADPRTVVQSYAITADILHSLDQALGYVGAAIREQHGEAAYIHGSFGSGKSHFMAVLSLLIADDSIAWGESSLHPLREKHEWVKGKKILRLHFNMIGARTTEERLFTEYLKRVREVNPEAPVPALFEDEALFANAQNLRETLGDDKFFAGLGAATAKKGWGKLGVEAAWDADSFDRARGSTDREERERLFSALVRTHFPAFADGRSNFVSLDVGLGRIARHARKIGYDAVVLFLDELILWLAGRAGDKNWMSLEVQKLAQLVEAQGEKRDAPIVSFIARQRDVSEMVGDQFAGVEVQNLRDTLRYWDGRFNTIKLEDRNLPTVVEKRVVRPRDAAAKKQIDDGFQQMRRSAGQSWGTLLGGEGDERAFRQVYPFSPALVEALVALSHYLQRERTALKVLAELLVEHLEDFEMGRVVPVGDLYDVLAGGEEPMDGHMRERFASARRLYQNELLPRIQAENGTGNRERCQRLREDHPVHLGCSNCKEARCRADNRLVKTLLLSALVPEAPVLRNLTVSRLVQLNHGTLKSPIPGEEVSMAAARLRSWSAEIGKLRVEGEKDPRVLVVLDGVDVRPILEAARGYDSPGAQRRLLREILFEALELEPGEQAVTRHKVGWRGTRREGVIRYGNVRDMDDAALTAPPEADFELVIDYPFDDANHGPEEDEDRLRRYMEKLRSPTVVWLPSFFGERVRRDLAELVVIRLVLDEPLRTHFANLRPDDQRRARDELEHLASQKRQRVRRAIEAAYGLKRPEEGEIDAAHDVDKHIHVLWPGWEIRGVTESVLSRAVEKAVEELLNQRFPRHPHFGSVTPAKLKGALERFERLCEADGERVPITKAERGDWEILERLGMVDATEASASLRREWVQEIEKALRAEGIERAPMAEQVRRRLDPAGQRGLEREVSDLEVVGYALASRRELSRGGAPIRELVLGKLPDDAELIQAPLPAEKAWQEAVERAGKLFGIALGGRARSARNLRLLVDKVREKRTSLVKERASDVAGLLAQRGAWLVDRAPRLATAERVTELFARLETPDAVEVAEVLGTFEVTPSSLAALKRHLEHAGMVARVLEDDVLFGVFDALSSNTAPEAQHLVAEVRRVLGADELNEDLAPCLKTLGVDAQKLLHGSTPAPESNSLQKIVDEGSGEGVDGLDDALRRARRAVDQAGPGARLTFSWKVTRGS